MAKIRQKPVDWMKAVILERMDVCDFTREDVAVLANIGVNTFRELMKQPPMTWRYEYRKAVLKALSIKIEDLPAEVQMKIAQF